MTTDQKSQGSHSHFIEDGKEIYPCWCGETHRGDWAREEWNHHNCLHREPLVTLGPAGTERVQTVCGECGRVFMVDLGTVLERT